MTSTLRLLAALGLACATLGAGASQIMGTGIGATNHQTVSGTTSQPSGKSDTSKSAKNARSAAKSASSPRK